MPARINPTARITPGSTVQVLEVARQFFSPLPVAGKLTVKEARLCKDGWFLVLDGYIEQPYPEAAFEVVQLAELGHEPEVPGLDAEIERLASQLTIPPGYEHLDFRELRARFSGG